MKVTELRCDRCKTAIYTISPPLILKQTPTDGFRTLQYWSKDVDLCKDCKSAFHCFMHNEDVAARQT